MESSNLQTFLTIIAQCSATYAAIIGGLVASQSISDLSEAAGLEEQLKKLDAETEVLRKRKDDVDTALAEDAACDYIDDNFDKLLAQQELHDVYDITAQNAIDFETLLPYWKSAQEAAVGCLNAYLGQTEKKELNEDDIPIHLAENFTPFQKNICARKAEAIKKAANPQSDPDRAASSFIPTGISGPQMAVSSMQRNNNREQSDTLAHNIEENKALRRILAEQLALLSKRGMVRQGSTLFVLVSLVDVLGPLIVFIFSDSLSESGRLWAALIMLVTFIIGIIIMTRFMLGRRKTALKKKQESVAHKKAQK